MTEALYKNVKVFLFLQQYPAINIYCAPKIFLETFVESS